MTKGYKHTAETKRKMSAAKKGVKLSPAHCEAMSKARKGKPLSPSHAAVVGAKKGVAKSPAHKAKMSAAHKARYERDGVDKHKENMRRKAKQTKRDRNFKRDRIYVDILTGEMPMIITDMSTILNVNFRKKIECVATIVNCDTSKRPWITIEHNERQNT